jgi:predicted ATPase/class 3 adenylate cyclase
MVDQPTGTVTLLFTDIEGSTRLLDRLGPERYREGLDLHRRLLSEAFQRYDGYEVDCEGDAFFVAFSRAADAVAAAAEGQRALAVAEWEGGNEIRVRMGIHTGSPLAVPPKYVGLDVHRAARIMAAGHGGQVLLSQTTRDLVGETAPVRDLGEHRLKDLSSGQRLYQLVTDHGSMEFPALKTLENRPTNLPVQPTALIGRERELTDVQMLLRRQQIRLVTLTGTGGTGKTRLALQVAASLVEEFPSGVFFVSLAPVRDPELVVATVAQTLGVREQAGEPLDTTLQAYLRDRRLLLLLDNFEQVTQAATVVSSLLAAAPHVSLLVTSRTPLHLSGERIYEVPPLDLPDSTVGLGVEELTQYESVALFIERAVAAKSGFALTNENAPAVAEICVRLDGLPLALELAAARIRVLSPQALLARLDERMKLLTGGAFDLDDRQRTLRATIDWSYDLLSEQEKVLFMRLSVFAGGCRIDAAEAVVDPEGEIGADLLEDISSLIDKSLLRQREDPDGEPRFWMLETIREYATQTLRTSSPALTLSERHARYFLTFAEQAAPELEGPAQRLWVARLASDYPNLRAALTKLLDCDPASALRLTVALEEYWYVRGLWSEGRDAFAAALSRGGPPLEQARALVADGWLAFSLGNFDAASAAVLACLSPAEGGVDVEVQARALLLRAWIAYFHDENAQAEQDASEVLSVADQLKPSRTDVHALRLLGAVAMSRGDFGAARQRYAEALVIVRQRGDVATVAAGLTDVGILERLSGNYSRARGVLGEALAQAKELDDKERVASVLTNLSHVARIEGDAAAARVLAEEALGVHQTLGSRHGTAQALFALANAASEAGDHEQAREAAKEVLVVCQELGDQQGTVVAVERLAIEAVAEQQHSLAAQLVGAAAGIRAAIEFPYTQASEADLQDPVEKARLAIGAATFAALEQQGRDMPASEAVALALLHNAESGPPKAEPLNN